MFRELQSMLYETNNDFLKIKIGDIRPGLAVVYPVVCWIITKRLKTILASGRNFWSLSHCKAMENRRVISQPNTPPYMLMFETEIKLHVPYYL